MVQNWTVMYKTGCNACRQFALHILNYRYWTVLVQEGAERGCFVVVFIGLYWVILILNVWTYWSHGIMESIYVMTRAGIEG